MLHKYIQSFDNKKIHYIIKRNKNKHFLIFIHGVGANWTIWKKQIEFFNNAGYSYIAIDLRGHGMSEIPLKEEEYAFLHFANDIKAILEKEKIKKFTFVGHSLGGGIAVIYLENFRKMPSSVVFIDSTYMNPFEKYSLFNLNKFIILIVRIFAYFQRLNNKTRKQIDFNTPFYKKGKILRHLKLGVQLKIIIIILDKVAEYTTIHQEKAISKLKKYIKPVLVISSLYDKIIPISNSEKLIYYMKNSKLKIIKDAEHTVMLNKANEVNSTILKFLENRKIKEYF